MRRATKNAGFSFHPALLSGRQQRARGRVPYNRRVARALRAARKHRYSGIEDWIPKAKGRGMTAVASDVVSALKNLGYAGAEAKRMVRSARGSDFDSLMRSALKGNPMAKKKKSKKKNHRKGKLPAGLAKYWAKKRRQKNKRRSRPRRRKQNRARVRYVTRVRYVKRKLQRRKKSNPRRRIRRIKLPITLRPGQVKPMQRFISRLTGRRVRMR